MCVAIVGPWSCHVENSTGGKGETKAWDDIPIEIRTGCLIVGILIMTGFSKNKSGVTGVISCNTGCWNDRESWIVMVYIWWTHPLIFDWVGNKNPLVIVQLTRILVTAHMYNYYIGTHLVRISWELVEGGELGLIVTYPIFTRPLIFC